MYQTLLRNKKVLFSMDKTQKDFTNSKNFWNFYQSSIKIKSDESGNTCPDSLLVNNELITNTFEITNTFNNYFASFATDSSIRFI